MPHLPDRPAHTALKLLHNKLNYKEEKKGMCFGITMRWIEACILGETDVFDKRVEKIEYIVGDKNRLLMFLYKIQHANHLSVEQRDILAFYDSVTLYQQPDQYADVYMNNFNGLTDLKHAPLAVSDKIQERGGIKKAYSQTILNDKKTLTQYLEDLGQTLESIGSQEPFNLLIGVGKHAISLRYFPGGIWELMNINTYPAKQYLPSELPKLVKIIGQSGVKEASELISFSLITTGKDPQLAKVEDKLKPFKGRHLPNRSQFTANPQAVSKLAVSAALEGDFETLELLISMDPTFLSHKNSKGEDALFSIFVSASVINPSQLAAFLNILKTNNVDLDKAIGPLNISMVQWAVNMHSIETLRELGKQGANLNKRVVDKNMSVALKPFLSEEGITPAFKAVGYNNLMMLKTIADYVSDLRQPIDIAIFCLGFALSNKNEEMVQFLKSKGLDLNQKEFLHNVVTHFALKNDGECLYLETLIKDAKINLKDLEVIGPLAQIAVEKGAPAFIQYLQKYNEDVKKYLPFAQLNYSINQLEQHGAKLKHLEGDKAVLAAQKMRGLVKQFIDLNATENSKEATTRIQDEFKKTMTAAQKDFKVHRHVLKPILLNILIAASVVGLIFMIHKFYKDHSFYSIKTKRQELGQKIEEDFSKLPPEGFNSKK